MGRESLAIQLSIKPNLYLMNLTQLKAVRSRLEKFIDQIDNELLDYQEDDFRKLDYEDDRQSFRKYLGELNEKRENLINEWNDICHEIKHYQ